MLTNPRNTVSLRSKIKVVTCIELNGCLREIWLNFANLINSFLLDNRYWFRVKIKEPLSSFTNDFMHVNIWLLVRDFTILVTTCKYNKDSKFPMWLRLKNSKDTPLLDNGSKGQTKNYLYILVYILNNVRDTNYFTNFFTSYWCSEWLLVNEKVILIMNLIKGWLYQHFVKML